MESGAKTPQEPPMPHLPNAWTSPEAADRLAESIHQWLDSMPKSPAVNPGHRISFFWPPESQAAKFHVLDSDWTGSYEAKICGETHLIETADTPFGHFGRCTALWIDAKASDPKFIVPALEKLAKPYFSRMRAISKCLGLQERFRTHVRDLSAENLLKLLFCSDRDVADEARIEIEKRGSNRLFAQAMIEVLKDDRHPYRRSAQWCVLDMFEDLPEYCRGSQEEEQAVMAMRSIIWNAEDDYARTAYKAGVVLGGHLPEKYGGPILIECLDCPSPIGRRSAIHGLFHVVEWVPELRNSAAAVLRSRATREDVPVLKEFALNMASDIASEEMDHVEEPFLPGELKIAN